METKDFAGNVTKSNEESFGVDTQPPSITHSNPLTVIDEGVDSPLINATFNDLASGVKFAKIFYRVSGSGSVWKSIDLLSGSAFIPAADVDISGIEYSAFMNRFTQRNSIYNSLHLRMTCCAASPLQPPSTAKDRPSPCMTV